MLDRNDPKIIQRLIEAQFFMVDECRKATDRLFENMVNAYEAPHASAIIARGMMTADSIASTYQTTSVTLITGAIIRYVWREIEKDPNTVVVSSLVSTIYHSFETQQAARPDRFYSYSDILSGQRIPNLDNIKTVIVLDDPLYYEGSGAEKYAFHHTLQAMFPSDDCDHTDVRIVRIN